MGRLRLLVFALVLTGCEIFVDDVGVDGQSCFDNHSCFGDLVCNFNTCTPPLSLNDDCDPERDVLQSCGNDLVCVKGTCALPGVDGEPCSTNYHYSYYDDDIQVGTCQAGLYCVNDICKRYGGKNAPCIPYMSSWDECEEGLKCIDDVCVSVGGEGEACNPDAWDDDEECDNGLRCVDGECLAPLPDEVLQSGAGLYWKRCIAGTTWDGRYCVSDYSNDTMWIWDDAWLQCPFKYRMPTREEAISLLANCDEDVLAGDDGDCSPCEKSDVCKVMFTQNTNDIWTSTPSSIDTLSSTYWHVDLETGRVKTSSYRWSYSVRCVRDAD